MSSILYTCISNIKFIRLIFEKNSIIFSENQGWRSMTDKIYYQNPYQFEFEARIISVDDQGKRPAVVLDRTCFYPEGGGQPADHGQLNNVQVLDVQQKNGTIFHYMDKILPVGPIKGRVDSIRRLDYMQQHTGQHVLSQSLLLSGGFHTVSVHFGEIYTAIETDAKSIPEEKLLEVESLANQVVASNVPVTIQWVDPDEVEKYHIRRPPPDVKKVRIVQVGDFDASACGGLHVAHTGEIGLIKITGQEKIRGRSRIQVKIGTRAYADYREKSRIIQELSQNLTCGEDTMVKRVTDLDEQLREANRTIARLQAEVMSYEVQNLIGSSPVIKDILFIHKIFENADNKILKIFLDQALTATERVAMALNKQDHHVNWIAGDTVSRPFNLRRLINPLLPIIDARGGGSDHLMQGGGKNSAGIAEFLHQFKLRLEKELSEHE